MKNVLLVLVFLITLVITPAFAADTKSEELFQQAMIKESAERDPEAALELYKQTIAEAGNDHRLVSKARLHMGNCLERLGKPKEAEAIYLQIIQESSVSLVEAVQAAQANLEKLQAQEKKAREQLARSKPMILVKEFQETRFTLSGGPGGMRSGTKSLGELELALRCRISARARPLALYGEIGAALPFGGTQSPNQIKIFDPQTTDIASVKLKYQTHLALVGELPHGVQKRIIPEIGVGAALTSSEIQYTSGSSGTQTKSTWSPYLSAGLHIFPERRVSLLVQGAYTANPYATSVQIPVPAHVQSFDFPRSIWTVSAKVQVKIGWTKTAMRPKE